MHTYSFGSDNTIDESKDKIDGTSSYYLSQRITQPRSIVISEREGEEREGGGEGGGGGGGGGGEEELLSMCCMFIQ